MPGKWTDLQNPKTDLTEIPQPRNCLPDLPSSTYKSSDLITKKRQKNAKIMSEIRKTSDLSNVKRKRKTNPEYDIALHKVEKKIGNPFNEMRKRQGQNHSIRKKDQEEFVSNESHYDNEDHYSNEESNDEYDSEMYDEDEDLSKYWSEYDTWGYDKRALGSMKKRSDNEDQSVRKRDQAVRKSDQSMRKRDQTVRKSDQVMRKSDQTVRKSDQDMRKRDQAMRKRDQPLRKRDQTVRKRDPPLEKSNQPLENKDQPINLRSSVMKRMGLSFNEAKRDYSPEHEVFKLKRFFLKRGYKSKRQF